MADFRIKFTLEGEEKPALQKKNGQQAELLIFQR